MTKFMLLTAMSVSLLAIGGCKAKTADAPAVKVETPTVTVDAPMSTDTKVTGYSKADYMKACQTAMTEAQCECYVDFYGSIGLKVTELGDSAKVQAAVTNMKPEKAMEMSKCMQ